MLKLAYHHYIEVGIGVGISLDRIFQDIQDDEYKNINQMLGAIKNKNLIYGIESAVIDESPTRTAQY